MKYMNLLILALALASLACLETTITATPPPAPIAETSDAAGSLAIIGDTEAEPAAGLVYEIPTTEPAMQDPNCAIVTADQALNLRAEPNENSRVIKWLYAGQVVTTQTQAGAWWRVTAGETTGYAHSAYLKETECE